MQTSAKIAVFQALPRRVKWKTITAFCNRVSPKDVVEDNIGDEKPITYADLYRIIFDHVSLHPSPAMLFYALARHLHDAPARYVCIYVCRDGGAESSTSRPGDYPMIARQEMPCCPAIALIQHKHS